MLSDILARATVKANELETNVANRKALKAHEKAKKVVEREAKKAERAELIAEINLKHAQGIEG